MPTDYEELTRKNEKALGSDRSSRASQIAMYSDWTHFIFEILQNADDYCAKTIRFEVTEDELVAEDDATRRLARLPANRAFWFGWYAQFPETELFTN